MTPEEYLKSKEWTFVRICSRCQGGALEYKKREYVVKLFITGLRPDRQFFKLYHNGRNTWTEPLFKLEEVTKDI